MQIGVDSFGAVISDPATGLTVKKEALRAGINFLYRGQGQIAVAFAGELRQGIDNRWRDRRNRRFTAS